MHDQTDLWVCRKFASAQNGNIHWTNYDKRKDTPLQPAGGWMSVFNGWIFDVQKMSDRSYYSKSRRCFKVFSQSEENIQSSSILDLFWFSGSSHNHFDLPRSKCSQKRRSPKRVQWPRNSYLRMSSVLNPFQLIISSGIILPKILGVD